MFRSLRATACAAGIAIMFVPCLVAPVGAQGPALPKPPAPVEIPDPEVLEQGPVHEAFAEPLTLDAQPQEVVNQEPPQPIEELPPEIKPEGNNVQWIGGYFQWDPERQDFVWVSGFYRDVPPGQQWVPGEWQQVEGGWQWFPGYWIDGDVQEVQFLPAPPATIEQGPSSPCPGDGYIWAPGSWRWIGGGYAWQAGYWYQSYPNWIWVPSHYTYTPYGHVFVRGYWDYPLLRRGLLYAPVYWRRGIHFGIGSYYRPRHVVHSSLLAVNLFIDRGHHHYYFGFHNRRPNWIHPWGHGHGRHGLAGRRGYYDPLWAHKTWHKHKGGPHTGRGGKGRPLVADARDFHRRHHEDLKLRKLNEKELAAQRSRGPQGRRIADSQANGRDRARPTRTREQGQIVRRGGGRASRSRDSVASGQENDEARSRTRQRGSSTTARNREDVRSRERNPGGDSSPTRARTRSDSVAGARTSSEAMERYLRNRRQRADETSQGRSEATRQSPERNRTPESSRRRVVQSDVPSRERTVRDRNQRSETTEQRSSRTTRRSPEQNRSRVVQSDSSPRERTVRTRTGSATKVPTSSEAMRRYLETRRQRTTASSQRTSPATQPSQASSRRRAVQDRDNQQVRRQRSSTVVRGQSPERRASSSSSQSSSRVRSYSRQTLSQVAPRSRSGGSGSSQIKGSSSSRRTRSLSSGGSSSRSRSFSSSGGSSRSRSFSSGGSSRSSRARSSGGGGGGNSSGKGRRRGR